MLRTKRGMCVLRDRGLAGGNSRLLGSKWLVLHNTNDWGSHMNPDIASSSGGAFLAKRIGPEALTATKICGGWKWVNPTMQMSASTSISWIYQT